MINHFCLEECETEEETDKVGERKIRKQKKVILQCDVRNAREGLTRGGQGRWADTSGGDQLITR